MTESEKSRWEAAYRSAEYQVMLESGSITLRIGQYDADRERQLRESIRLHDEWFIITPCNPRSMEAREELNLFYFNELRYELESRTGAWLQALNCDPSGEWPDEPGFLLADADRLWIMDMGRRFYQNALVTARIGEAPRLLWLQP